MVRMKVRRQLKYGNRQYVPGDVAEMTSAHARVFRLLRWVEEDVEEPVAEPVAPVVVVKPKRKYVRRQGAAQSDDARRYKRRDMKAEE